MNEKERNEKLIALEQAYGWLCSTMKSVNGKLDSLLGKPPHAPPAQWIAHQRNHPMKDRNGKNVSRCNSCVHFQFMEYTVESPEGPKNVQRGCGHPVAGRYWEKAREPAYVATCAHWYSGEPKSQSPK